MKETNKFAGRNEATIKPTSKDLLIQVNSFDAPLYIFTRFEPKCGKEVQLRDEIMTVIEPTRLENGCIRINLYESDHNSLIFFIHSKWLDEAAFENHIKLPHTLHFVEAVSELITHLRSRSHKTSLNTERL